MTTTTTTRTAPAAPVELPKRKILVDRSHGITYTAPATGKYVGTRHIAYKPGKKAAVTVRSFTPVAPDGAKWSRCVFDVITIEGQPPALRTRESAIVWNGTYWAAADKRARNMTAAVRLVLECGEPGDVVTPRARRGRAVTAPAASTPTTRTSAASRRAAANTRESGAELTAAMAASITAEAAARQATQNARPSEGGGSDVAKRPVRNETATQRRNRVKREQREAARAARNATTTAALASIDSALSTPEGGTDANVTPSA